MASFAVDAEHQSPAMIRTLPVEPSAAPWTARPVSDVLAALLARAGAPDDRPPIAALDGRQGSGKTTAAARLAAQLPGSVVVHTDDVAWWESFFGWDRLMATGIIEPLRRKEDVDYRPPAWESRGRVGSIIVSAAVPLVLIEGVGSSRCSLASLLDGAVWVQSDWEEANRRGIARDGGGRAESDFWWEWDREEQPFLAHDRPWERADLVLCGTPALADVEHDAQTELLVGRSLRPSRRAADRK